MGLEAGSPAQALPPDVELVARLRARDDTAFALVVDAWSGSMLRLARSFVSTNESAAEVLQETWLAVVRGIGAFEGRSSLKTWVFHILVNAAKRCCVREGRTIPLSSLASRDDEGPTVDPASFQDADEPYPGHWRVFPTPWPLPSPEQETLASEIRKELAAAMAELPDRQRIVILLRDVEGHTAAEVCSILEVTAANQRVLLHRARAYVRGRLEEYFASGREGPPEGQHHV